MSITPEQEVAISTQLSVDLSTVTDDRLIELCLLYRSAPNVLPSFATDLETEITRRFTASEIAINDVMFSVIQNFSNQFVSPIPFFAQKMLEMAASVNRDIWFQNNSALFTDSMDNQDAVDWLVTQPDVVTKILNNQFGLSIVGNSLIASTAILTNETTVAIWKNTPDLWVGWANYSDGMKVIAQSNELMNYTISLPVAMIAVAASSIALSKIVVSATARNALMINNTVFQSVRDQVYNTVTANWVKESGLSMAANKDSPMSLIDSAVANPNGFVFASLGWYLGFTTAKTEMKHPNNTIAATLGTSSDPKTLTNLDAVSFNGAILTARIDSATAYAELWSPPA